jgi:two-component system, sensor histidine kinase ChiS
MKQKIIRIASLIIVIFGVVLVFISSYLDLSELKSHKHFVSAGLIDLSKIENLNRLVELDGEWEFYEGSLLDTVKSMNTANRILVTVPGKWNQYEIGRKDPKSFGYGTFHLKIRLSEEQVNHTVGFRIQNIGMSNKVIISGQVVSMSGKPGVDRNSYVMGNVPKYVYFYPEQKELDVLIQVTNFDYSPYSGIVSSILFGPQALLEDARLTFYGYELLFLGASTAVGLVFFVLFLFRRKATYLLYFSMFILTSGLYILTHGEKIWFHIFPTFEYAFFSKIQFFSAALNISVLIGYLYTSFPEVFNNKITKTLLFVSIVFYPAVLFPLSIQSNVSSIQILFYILVIFYSLMGCVYGILKNHAYSVYFVLIIFSTLFMGRESIYLVLGKGNLEFWMLLAQFTWILLHGFLIAGRLSKTYDLVEEQAKELARVDHMKDEFLAKLSYALKSPLLGIANVTKLYMDQDDEVLTYAQRQKLSQILEFTRRLMRLVNDMTDISKIKEGKLTVEMSIIQTNKFLQSVATSMLVAYKDVGTRITFDIEDKLPLIRADQNRMKQIVFCLVDHALFSSKNKLITLSGHRDAQSLEIAVRYSVNDLDELNELNLFEPFSHQNDLSFESGLGLTIAKQLTELMGGTIEIQLLEEREICIKLVFQAYKSRIEVDENGTEWIDPSMEELIHNEEDELLTAPYSFITDGLSTLIVADENPMNLKLMVDILVQHNYSVIAVDNGHDVMKQLRLNPSIDLVIMDYWMQDPSGLEICRKLREVANRDDLPILMLITSIDSSVVEQVLLSGSNDFLYKPYQSNELIARVHSLVQVKKTLSLTTSYELAFLHAQIKPHFLYNALNTIAEYCETEPREAGKLIVSLSKYLRGTLDFENISSFVTVEKELSLVKAYLDIERARFDKLEVAFDVDDNIRVSLPPLTLQTLVENAVKHGVTKVISGGKVTIAIKQLVDGVIFTVEDDGVGMDLDKLDLSNKYSEKRSSIGLYNINTRLLKLYGKGLMFESSLGGGTKVSFIIPYGGSL